MSWRTMSLHATNPATHASRPPNARQRALREFVGQSTASHKAWDHEVETELQFEVDQLLEEAEQAPDEAGGGPSMGTDGAGGRPGGGMQRAVELSQRRVQRRAAVQALWQQYARGQHHHSA